jgi:pyruvate kinase
MAYHATTMANTVNAPLLVFSRQGNMPALLSHYRPDYPVFAFTGEEAVAWQSGRAWQVGGAGAGRRGNPQCSVDIGQTLDKQILHDACCEQLECKLMYGDGCLSSLHTTHILVC